METDIINKLTNKKLSSNSITLYLKLLKNINEGNEIKNLKFLNNHEKILEKLAKYKPTTQRNNIIAIVSILKALENPLYNTYYNIMINMTKNINENNKKIETIEIIKWNDVIAKFNELKIRISKIPNANMTEQKYNSLLDTVILSLYVLIPPRHNKDYTDMMITKNNITDNTKNYLDTKKQQFIFNVYKTSKKNGQLIIAIPDELMTIIKIYIKHHPMKSEMKTQNIPFLVYYNKKPIKDNSITRILNKIFDKKISSSILRHIYYNNHI
jgi:integrase